MRLCDSNPILRCALVFIITSSPLSATYSFKNAPRFSPRRRRKLSLALARALSYSD